MGMDNRIVFPLVVLVSGALVIETIHGSMPHADYNVPAPTVRVLNTAPASNVASQLMTMPADYQTVATHMMLIKG
jgi:hypothetical protein